MLSNDRPDSIPVTITAGRGASRTTETREITLTWNQDGSAIARAPRAAMALTKFNLALTIRFGVRVSVGRRDGDEWFTEIAAPFVRTPQCEAWISRPGRPSIRCTQQATRRLTIELDADLPSVIDPENTIVLCDECAGRYKESNGQRVVNDAPINGQAEVENAAGAGVQGAQA